MTPLTGSVLPLDALRWFVWLLALLLPGAAAWPLAVRLFPRAEAVAAAFSLALGVLLLSLSSWTLASLHLLPYRSWTVWLLLVLLAGACWGPRALRRGAREAWAARRTRAGTAVLLLLFVAALGAWSYVRGLTPAIDGTEKFMDFGFMMSLSRSDYLPAADMWLAGESINYYYFGQFVYSLLGTLSLTPPAIAYNLAMASTFAYLITLSAAVGWLWHDLRSPRRSAGSRIGTSVVAGLLTAFFAGLAGNAHAFFFAPGAPGTAIIRATAQLTGAGTEDWFYPASTRFIGYNPDAPDKTIHEFPFYSFLIGDLHAHLVNTMFVLLFLGLLIQTVLGGGRRLPGTRASGASSAIASSAPTAAGRLRQTAATAFRGLAGQPMPVMGALLLAVFLMGNYWDVVIYYTLLVVVALVMTLTARTGAGSIAVFACQQAVVLIPLFAFAGPLPATLWAAVGTVLAALSLIVRDDPLTRAGFAIAAILTGAHVLALPFRLSFEPIAQRVALAQDHTPLWQLAVLWGPQLLILLGGLVVQLRRRLRPWPAADRLAVALGICAVGLIFIPELVYVVDIYEDGYARANTMFKLTYQASILLGLLMPYVLMGGWHRLHRLWLDRRAPRAGQASRSALTGAVTALAAGLALAVAPAWYPFAALPQVLPSSALQSYRGLDGMAWMTDAGPAAAIIGDQQYTETMSDDAAAIRWLNANVTGQPVIVEAAGVAYTHLGRISAYTGLPTVLGWDTHEWLWRTSAAEPEAYERVVAPRVREIQEFFTDPDAHAADFLARYEVRYIIVGRWELSRYPGTDRAKIEALGEVVFRSGETSIVRIP